MFSSPWHPVISLPGLLKQKSRPQKSRALYRRENVHWTMFSRFATPKKIFMCPHTGHGEQCPVNVQRKCPVVLQCKRGCIGFGCVIGLEFGPNLAISLEFGPKSKGQVTPENGVRD